MPETAASDLTFGDVRPKLFRRVLIRLDAYRYACHELKHVVIVLHRRRIRRRKPERNGNYGKLIVKIIELRRPILKAGGEPFRTGYHI